MEQDQSSHDSNGHDAEDAFGQPQPITDRPTPVPAQSRSSTSATNGAGNSAGRFLQPSSAQPGQGETAPRSIPVKSMLGTNDARLAGAAAVGAVAAWPSIPDDRSASAYPTNQPEALPAPPAVRQAAALAPDNAQRLGWEAADSWGDVSYTIHLTANAAAGLSYVLWWVTGIIFWFAEKRNRYVRFHAWQSIMWTAGLSIIGVLGFLLTSWVFTIAARSEQPMLDVLGQALKWIFILTILGLWLWPMVAAFTGHYLRLPWIFGRFAERYSALPREPARR
jgi:uncharacterized membrane protein